MSNAARLERAVPLALFIGTAALLWWMFGHRLTLETNDEGIYLDAAERILHGQKPYVDFFGYMSPGSFWAQALAFRLFGISMSAGRVMVIGYVALQAAVVYWLVERYAARAAAIATTLFFLAFETADSSMLTAQHRWDSSALSLASIALCVAAQTSDRRRWLACSGMLCALAALATPSVALVAVGTLAWLAWPAERRSGAAWYLLGLSMVAVAAAAGLWLNGTLRALLDQFAWLSRNYSSVNVMHYGAIIGGYRALFEGATAWDLPIRCCLVFCIALPALLPVVALAGGGWLWGQPKSGDAPLRSAIPYLLLCIFALVASTYPRSDIAHLAYIAALPYAATGILLYRLLPARPLAWLTILIAVWAALFACQAGLPGSLRLLHTPVGDVQANASDAALVQDLLSRVHPHSSLFVYPYKPLLYFLTQTDNPTRYSYLAPGMMTEQDARIALGELEARPPDWVLYMGLDRAEFERVFPAGKSLDAHYPELESWIKANYRASGVAPLDGYTLLRRAQ